MAADNLEIVFRLVVALVAGAAIGFERSYQGRPAGIRTHALVCTASSLLMLVTAYETRWMQLTGDLVRLDPTRMAQGIMTGIGFYFPLIVGVVITLGVLSLFRFLEERMPSFAYFHFDLKLARATALQEDELRRLVESHGFSIANLSYRLDTEGGARRHSMVIRSPRKASARRLAETLEQTESVLEFRISPTGD